jgi:dihydroorotase
MSLVLLKSVILVEQGNVHHLKKRDILITNGRIEKIAARITAADARVIELPNLHASQGWFDSSVCFGEPGLEERETIENGLNTAASAGFTAVAVNPEAHPVPDSRSGIQFMLAKGRGHAVKLLPVGALTMESKGVDMAELYDMASQGAVAFGDYKRPLKNANLLKIALLYAQNFNALIQSMPLDTSVAVKGVMHEGVHSTRLGLKGIPALAEELQISRDLFLLEYTGGKLHIPTISTAGSVGLIRKAKKKGLDVSCSVAVKNLVLNDSSLQEFDGNFKLMPPIRSEKDRKALIKGLKDGTIDAVTSDHNPIDIEHKKIEFDRASFGSIGLESCFPALNATLGTEAAVAGLTGLKKRFGLEDDSVAEGATANLTLFEPDTEWVFGQDAIRSTSGNEAFLGMDVKGKVYGIINQKKLVLAK